MEESALSLANVTIGTMSELNVRSFFVSQSFDALVSKNFALGASRVPSISSLLNGAHILYSMTLSMTKQTSLWALLYDMQKISFSNCSRSVDSSSIISSLTAPLDLSLMRPPSGFSSIFLR